MASVLSRGVNPAYLAALLEVIACASAGSLSRVGFGVSVPRLAMCRELEAALHVTSLLVLCLLACTRALVSLPDFKLWCIS